MAKDSIRDYSATSSNNSDIQSVDISEGCAPSGLNNAIREVMTDLKNVSTGTVALETPVADSFSTDTISEKTSATGVTIDGVLLKDGAIGSIANAVAAHLTSINGGQIGGARSLIINGAFSIFQRGTGATTVNGNDVFAADRFKGWANGGGTFTVEQSTDVPNNEFEYSAKLTNTGVDSSVAAGDNYRWATDIEGYNVSQLGYGHSDAKAVTLSFWVKSSLAGTYCGALYSTTASRHYIYEYTISSANTWEKKTITVSSGDTTGSWNKTNGNGLRIYWGFGSGSTYQGTAGAWAAGEKWETTNQAAWIGSASATFYITGIQLEVGEVATAFEHESFAATLQKCMRYFETSYPYGTALGSSGGTTSMPARASVGTNDTVQEWDFEVTKRASPSVTLYGSSGASGQAYNFRLGANVSANVENGAGRKCFRVYRNGGSNWSANDWIAANYAVDAEL